MKSHFFTDTSPFNASNFKDCVLGSIAVSTSTQLKYFTRVAVVVVPMFL